MNDSTASNTSNWGNIYALDVWGDLYQKNPCDGTICPVKLYSDSLTVSVNNNKNQFDGYSYDSSGNLLNDQLGHAFTYDPENRPYAGGGANYYYDGEGERVAKSNGTLYLFGTGSAPVVETDLSGNLIAEYIFANGSRVATRKSGGSIYYYFADQVGSAQVVTGALGGVQQKIEYHPYGEETIITNNVTNNYRFTGKEHDNETNDDYFGARYYGSSFGRFLTPDWAATPVPIPYAVMGNPQTLNLYSYVENNPITGTDPDGHAGEGFTGNAGGWYDCLVHNCPDAQQNQQKQPPPPPPPPPKQEGKSAPAQNQSASPCQGGGCNVKVISDSTTPSPFVPGVVNRHVTYQAVDSSGKTVSNTEISLHETPLPGKEGGDAKSYGYCGGNGCSNSAPAPKAEGDLQAGRFNDRMSQGSNGPAAFKQTYTVQGKPAKIIWPTKNGNVTATSQTVRIRADKVVIIPEVSQ